MPTELYYCLTCGCRVGVELWSQLVDFFVPMFTQFFVFGGALGLVLGTIEKRKKRSLLSVLEGRLLFVIDRLVCSVLEVGTYKIQSQNSKVKGAPFRLAFGGLNENGTIKIATSSRSSKSCQVAKENLEDLLGVYSYTLAQDDLRELIGFEARLSECEWYAKSGDSGEYANSVSIMVNDAIELHALLTERYNRY